MGDLENKFSIDGFVVLNEVGMETLFARGPVILGPDKEVMFEDLHTGIFYHEKTNQLEGTPPAGFPQINEPIMVPGLDKFMRFSNGTTAFKEVFLAKYACDDPFWAELWIKRGDLPMSHHYTYQTEV